MPDALDGAVEAIYDGRSVLGWARLSGASEVAEVRVFRGSTLIGVGRCGIDREDLGGRFGFQVTCEESIAPEDIVFSRLCVQAHLSGVTANLRLLSQVRRAGARSLVEAMIRDDPTSSLEAIESVYIAHEQSLGNRMSMEAAEVSSMLEKLGISRPNTPGELSSLRLPTGEC
ncbi:MAG: hypothetical protein J0H67_14130, partial [Rhodospirillales bacterium]|nr:hypothetical protein [Rhodospirillales bacterium]